MLLNYDIISNMESYKKSLKNNTPESHKLYYWIYISMFGVIWGVGTSVLAGTLPPDPITRSLVITWLEVTIIILIKVIFLRKFCVTHAMIITILISVFTFSFGPPNPFKMLLILAGIAFDFGTFLQTKSLKLWHLIIGFICFILVAYPIFTLIVYLIEPSALSAIIKFIPIAAGIYLTQGIILSVIIWKFINPNKAPAFVSSIRNRINKDEDSF